MFGPDHVKDTHDWLGVFWCGKKKCGLGTIWRGSHGKWSHIEICEVCYPRRQEYLKEKLAKEALSKL